jgi:NDP-sugar pyrophosphorylase family protein
MRAVILAAGEGRRLHPLTKDVPKPMLTVAGRPILEFNVRLLARYGITDIAINTHHCAGSIVEHFGDGSSLGVKITYAPEKILLGTAGALIPLRECLSSTFVVLYGDNLTTCNIAALVEFHRSKGGAVSLAVYKRENATAGGIVSIASDDHVERFLEKPRREEIFSSWVNAGVMICEPKVFDFIPPGPSDFGKDVLPLLAGESRELFAYRMREPEERLWWIDSPEDYARTMMEAAT